MHQPKGQRVLLGFAGPACIQCLDILQPGWAREELLAAQGSISSVQRLLRGQKAGGI